MKLELIKELRCFCRKKRNLLSRIDSSLYEMIDENFQVLLKGFIDKVDSFIDEIIADSGKDISNNISYEDTMDLFLEMVDSFDNNLVTTGDLKELESCLDDFIKDLTSELYARQNFYYEKNASLKRKEKKEKESKLVEKILKLRDEKNTYYDIAQKLEISERRIKYLLNKKKKVK